MKKLLVIAMTAVLLISLFAVNLSAAELSIPRALTAPVIDGKINADEWANALAIDMKQDNLNWVLDVNPSSGNSMYYFMWDAGYIYFAADVKDTTVSDIIPSYGAALNSGDRPRHNRCPNLRLRPRFADSDGLRRRGDA